MSAPLSWQMLWTNWAFARRAATRAVQTRNRIPRQSRSRLVPYQAKNHPAIVNGLETKQIFVGEQQESEPSPRGRNFWFDPFSGQIVKTYSVVNLNKDAA